MSSDELWRQYSAASSAHKSDEAFESFAGYVGEWLESRGAAVAPSPMISSSSDRYGALKPCIAFEIPEQTAWLLSQRPQGLLEGFQVYLEDLVKRLKSKSLPEQLQQQSGRSQLLKRASQCMLVLARVAGCRDNYQQLSKFAGFTLETVMTLLQTLLDLCNEGPSAANFVSLTEGARHVVAFVHCLVDPQRTWQRSFMHLHNSMTMFNASEVVPITPEIPDIFVDLFKGKWGQGGEGEGKEAWLELQLDLVHLMGALFSSSRKDNRELASSEKVCLLLLNLFDPREHCTALQVLVTKLFVKVVHVLHTSITEIGVDSAMMLVSFVNIFSCRYREGDVINPCIRMVTTLLDAIPSLLDSPEGNKTILNASSTMSENLKQMFVEVGCYEKISEVLKLVAEEAKEEGKEAEAQSLVGAIFKAFSAVTKGCPNTRQSYEQRVGHLWLFGAITKVVMPTEAILQEALNMIVEGVYKFNGQGHTVYNTSAVKMLFHGLPTLPAPLQEWLGVRLLDMCGQGSQNLQRCCNAGVFSTVLRILTNSQTLNATLPQSLEDVLIEVVDILGTHSMRTGELKQLIGALRPLENGMLPTYYYRLLKSLTTMADANREGVAPLYYFDLRTEDTYMSIPELKRFPTSSSLTFHMWVSLDSTQNHTHSDNDLEQFDSSARDCRKKRILYSFYTNGGTGFEAFFVDASPKTCVLVVATVTKKEFITLSLQEFPLETNRWYSIGIVYSVAKRPWGKSEVQVYIDGESKKFAVDMKMPNFSDVYTSGLIGFGPSCGNPARVREVTPPPFSSHTIVVDPPALENSDKGKTLQATTLGDVVLKWGVVSNLKGLLSSFAVFSDTLNAANFASLHAKGPNDLSLYQYKCTDTYDLGTKLILYYNAKSVTGDKCTNLSPQYVGGTENLHVKFTGQNYITWDIKAVLGPLGGVELLFPILEQVPLPIATRSSPDSTSSSSSAEKLSGKPPFMEGWYGESEGIAAFLKLLMAMLTNNQNNQSRFFQSEGPATVAALLMRTPPTLLTVTAFHTVQELVELCNREEETRLDIYKHLIFDFRVWARPSYSVRIGHIQYISNILRNNDEFRHTYGAYYIMDVIRVFYSSNGSESWSSDTITLSPEETLSIRAALLMILKYYLLNSVVAEEVEGILAFSALPRDPSLQEELLSMLKNLLTKSDCGWELGRIMWEKGIYLLSLLRAPNMQVRLISIKIVSYLVSQFPDAEGPLMTAFKEGSIAAAIGHMTEPDMSSAIVLALTELCVTRDPLTYTDSISHLDVFMAVLQLLQQAPLAVRNTLCQLLTSILHHTPEDIPRLSSVPGWEVVFMRLLTPFYPHLDHTHFIPQSSANVTTPPATTPTSSKEHQPPPDTLPLNPVTNGNELSPPPSYSTVVPEHPLKPRPMNLTISSPPESPLQSDRFRKRSSAVIKDKSPCPSDSSDLKSTGDTKKDRYDRKASLVSTPWAEPVAVRPEEEDAEVTRAVDIVTQLFRCILWSSTIDQQPWKVWGKFFCLFAQFEREHELITPPATIKQKLLTLLCHDVMEELKQDYDRASCLQKLLYLSQLLESFIICTYPTTAPSEDQEVLLIKLAHNFFPEISIQHYSRGLQEQYLKMLTVAGLFDKEVAFTSLEMDITQSALRIFLGCLASGNKEYYVTASLRLEHMLKCPLLTIKDVFFIFSNLARIARLATEEGDTDWLQYIATILRTLFSANYPQLKVDQHLKNLPDHRTPDFGHKFGVYCNSTEWKSYMEGVLKTAEVQYSDVLMRWLVAKTERDKECAKAATLEDEARKTLIVENEMQYQRLLVHIGELLSEEQKRQESTDSQLRNELSVTLQKWRATKRFFTGERGAWSSRKVEPYLWKLDRTENFSRMRMRLARNYNVNRHEAASKMRDTGESTPSSPGKEKPDTELLAKVSKRMSSSVEEEEEVLLEQLWSDANSPAVRGVEGQEEPSVTAERSVMKGVKCHLILLMDSISGLLDITNKHLYFLSDQSDKHQSNNWYSTDFKIPLSQMREIHSRRYNMSRTAFEIFLVDQTNYFINFPSKKVVSNVYSTIVRLHPPNLNKGGIRKPARLLRESGLTNKWVKREISNFDYLMQLNTISGRTYNDLNQYPVFPWVLKDYTSQELNLEDETVYRDLSRPVGIQKDSLKEKVEFRYEEIDDPTLGKFHFGSHYSNAAGVMHYLIRMEPFTSLHVELQSGRFDFADRQFFSIPSTWANIYNSGTDQKELIPEFYYQPAFLRNINGLDLGKLQTGMKLDHVILPPWASSPEDFIIKHKEALESEYVSSHLHEWIDLIFGYKQTGPEAVKACNIFNFYTYEENVNLDSIKDPKERRQIESIINNFGQTPTQLFTEPHPQCLPLDVARKTQAKGFTATFTGRRNLVNLFENLSLLKAHSVDVCQQPVVFVGTPSIQTKALLVSGNPEQLVTVNEEGLLNIHGWLPFSSSKHRPFTFQFDPNAHFDRSRWQFIGGPFTQDIAIRSNLFVLSPNNKYIVSGGHWDNSFRVHQVEKGKLSARISHHNDVVTCMSLDKVGGGDHLITGSRDTSCAIWKFGTSGVRKQPTQVLYGHDSEVLCVSISTELDLALSGAKDGTCLLHTVRQGLYLSTLRPRKGHKCEIHQVAISTSGRLVVYSEDVTHRQRLLASVPPCLHLYDVNGLLLLEKELVECINALIVVDKYLVTGNTRGFLTFRSLFTLQQVHSLNLLEPIYCISVVLDYHSKLSTHLLVGLASGKLIIVSVKDTVTQVKSN